MTTISKSVLYTYMYFYNVISMKNFNLYAGYLFMQTNSIATSVLSFIYKDL